MFSLFLIISAFFIFRFTCGAFEGIRESVEKRNSMRSVLEKKVSSMMEENDSLEESIKSIKKSS